MRPAKLRPIHLVFDTFFALQRVRWPVRVLLLAAAAWLIVRGDGRWVEAVALVAGSVYAGVLLFLLAAAALSGAGTGGDEEAESWVPSHHRWLRAHPLVTSMVLAAWGVIAVVGMASLISGLSGWLLGMAIMLVSSAVVFPGGVFLGGAAGIYVVERSPEFGEAPADVRAEVRWNKGGAGCFRRGFYVYAVVAASWLAGSIVLLARGDELDDRLVIGLDIAAAPCIPAVLAGMALIFFLARRSATPAGREAAREDDELNAVFGHQRARVWSILYYAFERAFPAKGGEGRYAKAARRAQIGAVRAASLADVRRALAESLGAEGFESTEIERQRAEVERIARYLWQTVQEARASGGRVLLTPEE